MYPKVEKIECRASRRVEFSARSRQKSFSTATGVITTYASTNLAAQQPKECSEQKANAPENETEADESAASVCSVNETAKQCEEEDHFDNELDLLNPEQLLPAALINLTPNALGHEIERIGRGFMGVHGNSFYDQCR